MLGVAETGLPNLMALFSTLMLIETYISGGGSVATSDTSFNDSHKTNNDIIGYGEVGFKTIPIYHISLNLCYRFTEKVWRSVGNGQYQVGGDSWILGVTAVF